MVVNTVDSAECAKACPAPHGTGIPTLGMCVFGLPRSVSAHQWRLDLVKLTA
jgi:hypothetical protein